MVALATQRGGEVGFGARVWGALCLRAAAYRELAGAPAATRQALVLVLGVALLRVLARALARVGHAGDTALLPAGYGIPAGYALDLPQGVSPQLLLAGRLGVALVFGLLAWSARARMLRLAMRVVLHQQLPRAPFLRIVGYGEPFGLVALVPLVGPLLGLLLTTVASIVGVRALTGATTAKAILVGLLALLFTVLFIALLAAGITVAVVFAMRRGG